MLKIKQAKILFKVDEVANRWREYLEDIYAGKDINNSDEFIESEQNLDSAMNEPEFTKKEIDIAIL